MPRALNTYRGDAWHSGTLPRGEGRFAVVVSRFNESITPRLLERRGAKRSGRTAWPTSASTWPGCPAHSRFPPWPADWPPAGDTRRCSAWGP